MSLKLRNTWEYKGDDRWDWEVFIDDGGSGEINEIKYVEYILHPTFPKPVRKIYDSSNGFRLKSNGWGSFTLKAFIHKKNGMQKKLTHQIELKYSPKSGTSV